ncbi:MAG: hypothetical protein ACFFBI_04650 [Promethearchaeota archaeon]
MINKELLKELLDINNRHKLFEKILVKLKSFSSSEKIDYFEFQTSEGKIPIIKIGQSSDLDDVKYVKVFVGAQHNEYNGLFGVLEFLNLLETPKSVVNKFRRDDQVLIFAPLMNPYGFIHPRQENKSGYYLKNGTNLNRYWRRTFAPGYEGGKDDLSEYPTPEHTNIIKNLLKPYWLREDIQIYILDFHETSLLERFSTDLANNLHKESINYKFSHWLKEGIVYNIIKLYKIPYFRKPLFFKCTPNADHTHINLTIRQLDKVYEKLQEYVINNQGKLKFYFCYTNRSKEFCEKLAQNVHHSLSDILWETYFPAFNHSFHNHGCFVNMNEAITRKGVYSMELESQKEFFNIFEEIEKAKSDVCYFDKKMKYFRMSIKLAVESIKEMISLF